MAKLPKKLLHKLKEREANNALRSLSLREGLIDFSSNDYLGFACNEELFHNTLQILTAKGLSQNGATGSRLLTGNYSLYSEVEQMLCNYYKAEEALVFNSGYDANIGFFASVPQRNDVVFYDEFVHASIRDGIKLGNARAYKFKHNNLQDLRLNIGRLPANDTSTDSKIYVVTESVFSMDGDSPDLRKLSALCEEFEIRLIVDEAHAIGIFGDGGSGQLCKYSLELVVFARVITFGKAWGCHGAAILCSEDLKAYLVNYARSFIYSTGLPPHALACILAAHQFIKSDVGLKQQQKLWKNIDYFKEQLKNLTLETYFIESNSGIHSCILKGNNKVKQVAANLREQGMDVRPILSPTVTKGEERLRFCLHAFNNEGQILDVLRILKDNIVRSPILTERN